MRRLSILLFIVSVLGAPTAFAADSAQAKVIKDLDCLVGTWSGVGQSQEGAETHTVHFEYTCKESSGGFGVSCHLTMTGIPGFTYQSDDLWGYDPGGGKVHWYTVTNAGETHDHAGVIEGNAFVAAYVGRQDGKPMRENIRMEFHGDNELSFSSVVYVAHHRTQSLTGTATRQGANDAQASGH